MVVSVASWSVHPDFWECRPEVDYKIAYARARWLVSLLASLFGSEGSPESLRLAVELYGASFAVLQDGTAVAWIGPDPDDAQVWAELAPDEVLPLGSDAGLSTAA
jgi:hypothetical protein